MKKVAETCAHATVGVGHGAGENFQRVVRGLLSSRAHWHLRKLPAPPQVTRCPRRAAYRKQHNTSLLLHQILC